MTAPHISFVIPAYNEGLQLPACICSIRDCLEPFPEHTYEIVVCDNNSSDNTSAVAESHGARVVFEPHNQIAKARNTGAQAARGTWLCFIDADTVMPPTLGKLFLEAIKNNQSGGGGTLVQFDLRKTPWFAGLVVNFWNTISFRLNLAAGSFLFCQRQAWVDVGGFDEDFYAAEELVFSKAIKKWCRANSLKFRIIKDASVLTSARKIEWNTPFSLFCTMIKLLRPGALKSREQCAFWYERP